MQYEDNTPTEQQREYRVLLCAPSRDEDQESRLAELAVALGRDIEIDKRVIVVIGENQRFLREMPQAMEDLRLARQRIREWKEFEASVSRTIRQLQGLRQDDAYLKASADFLFADE